MKRSKHLAFALIAAMMTPHGVTGAFGLFLGPVKLSNRLRQRHPPSTVSGSPSNRQQICVLAGAPPWRVLADTLSRALLRA
jgi:hypothetical protein